MSNFICKICNSEFKSEHALNIHIGQYEKMSKLDYLIKYNKLDMICPICKINNKHIDKSCRIQKNMHIYNMSSCYAFTDKHKK